MIRPTCLAAPSTESNAEEEGGEACKSFECLFDEIAQEVDQGVSAVPVGVERGKKVRGQSYLSRCSVSSKSKGAVVELRA